MLLIINDGASSEMYKQHDTVMQVLEELGATEQPRIEVINKCDLGQAEPAFPGAVMVSALNGDGLAELHRRIAAELQKTFAPVTFVLPFSQYGLVSQIRPLGRVVNEAYTDEGTELTIIIGNADRDRLVAKYGKQIIKE